MYDPLKVLNLGFVASETEIKVQFWAISRIYHPEKHKMEQTGMSEEDLTTIFHVLNNSHSYLE